LASSSHTCPLNIAVNRAVASRRYSVSPIGVSKVRLQPEQRAVAILPGRILGETNLRFSPIGSGPNGNYTSLRHFFAEKLPQ
jgi:hypothetical protein